MKTNLALTRPAGSPAAAPARPAERTEPGARAERAARSAHAERFTPAASTAVDAMLARKSGGGGFPALKVPDIGGWWDRHVERPFAMGRDGFVAVDSNGAVVGGRPPSARVRDHDLFKSPLDPLVEILGDAERRDVTFTLPGGGKFSTRTDDSGASTLPMGRLAGADLRTGVDPKRGGVVSLGVSTPNGSGDEANVLVLPKDYDGPIFVCDIDDTLRDTSVVDIATGKSQAPISGAKELLQSVAARGIPIVYLSAGPDRIRQQNEAFLDKLPPGIFLDRDGLSLKDLHPSGDAQARQQGEYKAGVLGSLRQAYPGAQLFGLGDDKYGDALAYTQQGATAYIHDVGDAGADHLPANFHGVVTNDYSAGFRAQVGKDLDEAIARSRSFGGTPPPGDPWMERFSRTIDQLTGTRATDNNDIVPLIDGDAARPEILRTIDSAKKSLYYETFELHGDDKVTKEVVDKLIAAHQRGVKVRVAVDAFGSRDFPPFQRNPAIQRLRAAGVEVAIFNPIDSVKDLDILRDHRKTIIADNTTAFVGGMNTGDGYMGSPAPGRMHDVFAKMQGPEVADVVQGFYDSWKAAGGSAVPASEQKIPPPPVPVESDRVRIITHVPDQDQHIRAAYLAMFDSARERINVENTFPMSDDLVASLAAAAKRGVNVRYIVDPSQDVTGRLTQKNFQKLLDAGVHIYVYPGPVHTKAISVDGKVATVGSSNVDNMALNRDREIIAMVEDPEWVRSFDAQLFERDVVGHPDGRKTLELPRKLDVPFWDRLKNWILDVAIPDGYE